MKNIGVILARFQPIHNGHIELIKKACDENDSVLILIGSADKLNARNPIPIDIRISLVKQAILEMGDNYHTKCSVVAFDDLTSETDNSIEWGFYLYANVVKNINQHNFTMYYSDGFEIITSWFTGSILRNHVSLSLLARGNTCEGLSATQVRQKILLYHETSMDFEGLKKYVPNVIIDNIKMIYTFLKLQENMK